MTRHRTFSLGNDGARATMGTPRWFTPSVTLAPGFGARPPLRARGLAYHAGSAVRPALGAHEPSGKNRRLPYEEGTVSFAPPCSQTAR
jgi:hypothetical protein